MKKWKIGWGVTNNCNMKCPFCYSKDVRENNKDLDVSIMKKFIDKNFNYIDSINYGTGENTLSKAWMELLNHVGSNYSQISQALTTNGHLAELYKDSSTRKIIESLDEVDVSFDLADKSKYNIFRGNSNAYDWVIETIKICKEYGIETTLVTIGLDETLKRDNLERILELAAKYDCYFRVNIFRPNANQNLKAANYEIFRESIKWLVNQTKIVSLSDALFSAVLLNEKKTDNSGSSSLRILPDGSITPSTYLVSDEWICGNIKDDISLEKNPFKNINTKIDLDNNIPEKCSECSIKDICKGGALDRRIIWYKELGERDPYCPYRNNDSLESWKIKKPVEFINGPSVHDGYLPTLIFKP